MREGESRVAGQQSRRGKEKYDVFGEEGIPVETGGRSRCGGCTVGVLGGPRQGVAARFIQQGIEQLPEQSAKRLQAVLVVESKGFGLSLLADTTHSQRYLS